MPGAPARPVTPGLAALGRRDGQGGHAGGGRDPPGRAKQAGAGGTRSMLGAREGRVPAWRRWETQGCGGTSPVLGGGRGRERHPHGHPSPSPTPHALCPFPAAAPGSPVLTWGSPQRCSPRLCHFSSQGLWGLLFSPCGGLGGGMEPEGRSGVQGPSLARGPGGQDGVQGPPLAQPLMSPVLGLGGSGARADPTGVRVDWGWQGGGRCPGGSCQALGLSLLGRGVPSPCQGLAGTGGPGRGGGSAQLHAAHT